MLVKLTTAINLINHLHVLIIMESITGLTRCQFHQHFSRAFFANILLTKSHKAEM